MSALCQVSLAALLLAGSAHADPPRVSVDPAVRRAIDTGLLGGHLYGAPHPGSAPVLVELRAPADAASLDALARAGVRLAFVDGKPLAYDRFVPADVDRASLAAIEKLAFVERVASAGPRGLRPLDQSAKLIRLADARGARPALGSLTGEGILIADMDSMVDPFEPAFFKGDGGYFDWIDVDGDGVFTPGTDAIDLDQNGAADSTETAQPILARMVDYYGSDVGARTNAFDPSIDFLYLDTNGNGKRDYGADAGFDDTTPALGEPLFVPDDANRNGKLDVGERVVRLSTPKIRKIFVNLAYPPYTGNHVYERGVDLSQAKLDWTGGTIEGGYPDAFHATAVTTILVGDVPLVGRRWVGIAPDAEVETAWDVEGSATPLKGFTWALKDNPDVALFEMAEWSGVPLDGSDALSTLIDASVAKSSITATCPTGDQGSALKHAHADLAAAQQVSLPFDLPAHAKGRTAPLTYVDVSVDVRGGTPASVSLAGPNGESVQLTTFGQGTLSTGDTYYSTYEVTKRATGFYDVVLYMDKNQPPLPVGTWHLNVSGDAAAATTVDAYVSDDQSSWAVGAAWDSSVATDAMTVGVPSVADHCIAVNAAPDHVGTPDAPYYDLKFYAEYNVPPGTNESQGQVRAYSPRGPRIDGTMKPDVTAPDNPWTANLHLATSAQPYGSYSVFGGTSGASPHVTGAAALLAQAGIRGDAARDALRAGAIVDADTGAVPNGDYGWGRLDVAHALGVATAGVDPSVTIAVSPANPTTADTIELTADAQSNDGNDSALEAEWDDGYDGTWDAPWAGLAPHAFVAPAPGRYPFKVRVRNSGGRVAEAVAWVDVVAPAVSEGCSCRTSVGDETHRSDLSLAFVLLAGLGLLARARRETNDR